MIHLLIRGLMKARYVKFNIKDPYPRNQHGSVTKTPPTRNNAPCKKSINRVRFLLLITTQFYAP